MFRAVFWVIRDDGGSTHLWNVSRQSIYTAVQPRRQLWTSYSLLLFTSMGWDSVPWLRSPTGLLFFPRTVHECEVKVEWFWQRKTEELWDIVYISATLCGTKPIWVDPGVNTGFRGERSATNRLNHGTDHLEVFSASISRAIWAWSDQGRWNGQSM
jgi:hypothetical protein